MSKNFLTLTVIANMSSNYGESIGNSASIQKTIRNGKTYGVRSYLSLKNELMEQIGFNKNLKPHVEKKVATKEVSKTHTIEVDRALEGGYMLAIKGNNHSRKTSFTITDAVDIYPFDGNFRFNTNLRLARLVAQEKGKNLQDDSEACGLMPFNWEESKGMKIYSITINLSRIGIDEDFDINLPNDEKYSRVVDLLEGIQNLSLSCKGKVDNAEPLFIIGGLTKRASHEFENLVKVIDNKIDLNDDFIERAKDFKVGILGNNFDNTDEVKDVLGATTINKFFEDIIEDVKIYYKD